MSSRDGRDSGRRLEVYLVDGTYELFRHFYGQPRGAEPPRSGSVSAAIGVVNSLMGMIGSGATHIGVATDHVIESFRNDLWPGYKTGEGVDEVLLAQFEVLELLIEAAGITLWPMTELEADDAMASAARIAASDKRVQRVFLCTPDKDLAQCVVGDRVVQMDRRHQTITDEGGVWEKFGVAPKSIPDWLGLVGDSADGFPGLSGWGKQSASTVLAYYGHIEDIPDDASDWDEKVRKSVRSAQKLAATLAADREKAMLFLDLATLRSGADVISGVEDLAWRGPTDAFADVCHRLGADNLARRAESMAPR